MTRDKNIRRIITALILLAALAGTISFILLLRNPAQTVLQVSFPESQSEQTAPLDQVFARFTSLYPNIRIQIGTSEQADVAIITNPVRLSESWLEQPVPWSGSLWLLAARKDILDKTARTLPAEIAALRAGSATPEQFRTILGEIRLSGTAPITLGNSHKWPFLLWLQHWAACTRGPDTVASIGAALSNTGALAAAFSELTRWKEAGWFAPGLWSEGWAEGLAPLATGDAAFALVSAGNLAPIQPEARAGLEYLRFPHRTGDPNWSIGSAAYLGIRANSHLKKEARLLVRFLTSPGITSELATLTGRPYFAWNPETGKNPSVTASWAEAALSPEYNALSRMYDPGN